MGMGLAICRSIIEAHDGRLWATPNVPHGATFQFSLPVNADTASWGFRKWIWPGRSDGFDMEFDEPNADGLFEYLKEPADAIALMECVKLGAGTITTTGL
jgi:hypothetical protein